ncbi:hypothetical protein MULP_03591 [Mycobacterium liflandii 128FXT]|uniref:Peptidase M28 domain-containing protein n=1 Tax=Mycobacterium liflandii (strain 128FXT) TaxID=459424 RepID=L7V619_MYCL1|nr:MULTISPECIES: hypothetical protein [Mycobacterium ulcerans group]AGC63256.1 hypothetical protein MULP_03591 [Mycobacterium liflandii 128FXT]
MDDRFVVAELDLLAKLGPRFPGSDAHERLVAHVARQWAEFGMDVREDVLRFERWDPPAASDGLRLTVDGQVVEISSAFPYSGTTGPDGVRGRLVHLRGLLPRWSRARGGIAVIEMVHNRELPASAAVGSWDPDDPWGKQASPIAPATLAGFGLKRAARAGVKGVVLVWRGVSAANARGQYVPFTLSYRGIPAVFVAGEAADAVLHAARRGAQAELVLDAALTKDASMRTVWAAVEGTQRPRETVLVVTHSDGTNVVEENGHIGLVHLARDVMAQPPERTVVFVFVAGHLRIPAIVKRHGQATSRWLSDHRDWWAAGPGQRRAVAGLVIEHLGALEYRDDPAADDYGPTGCAEPELLYASTRELRMLADIEWRGIEPGPTRVSMPNELIQLGEGQPLYLERIPNISLVTVPQYLLSTEPGDYVDIKLLQRQVDGFARLLHRLDTLPAASVGTIAAHTTLRKISAGGKLVTHLLKR